MKKFTGLLTAVIVSGFALTANAGTIRIGEADKTLRHEKRELRKEAALHAVNERTAYQFRLDFPAATEVHWLQTAFAEASFMENGVLKTAYYDDDHNWVATTTELSLTAIPEKAVAKIRRDYPGYTTERVILLDDNENNSSDLELFPGLPAPKENYYAQLKKGTKEIILEVSPAGEVSYFARQN